MERDFLRNLDLGGGTRLPKEAIEAIMAEYGKEVNNLLGQVKDLTNERDSWQQRAEKAEGILQGFGDDVDPTQVLKDLADAKESLKTAKEDFDKQLADRDFDDALEAALKDVKFSSESARRDVMGQVKAAGLPVKDKKILGLSDLLEQIKGQDSAAFVDEKQAEREANKARFTAPTTNQGKEDAPKTREEIMAIRDRKARRAAIAENLKLFENDKEET